MAKQYRTLHAVKYYRDYLGHDVRPDGRELDGFRPVVINVGSIVTADGSAIAKIGQTTVVCGIKAELSRPKAEKPNEGYLIPNVELPPLCSPKFRPGPPGEAAQVATQSIMDILENSGCVDLKELCIVKDKVAWCLYADLVCLDFDGAIIDACLTALVAALKTVTLPLVNYDAALDRQNVDSSQRKPLTVHCLPVSTTFAVFEDKTLLWDPTGEEETLSSAIVNVVTKGSELCSVCKPGGSPLSDEQLSSCINGAKERAALIAGLIDGTAKKEK